MRQNIRGSLSGMDLRPALSLLCLLLCCQAARAAKFENPAVPGDYPDPSIVRVGDDFYMTNSSMMWAPGLLIWHSKDLVHWEPVVRALKNFDGDVWAPDIVRHQGKFFIYYPSSNNRTNRVIAADRIEGPWSEPVDLKVGEIDPGHVVGPDGTRYLHLSKGNVVKLAPDGLSVDGPRRKVYEGWPFPEDWKTEGFCLEGPKLFFHDGWYHLISAQGGTAGASTSHMAVHARSRSPEGPWENSPYNPLIKTWNRSEKWWSTGHATVFETGRGQWWAVFHGYDKDNRPLGRQVLLRQVEWTKDGWLVAKKGTQAGSPAPDLAPAPLKPMPVSDSFAGPELGIQWSFWGGLDKERIRFEDGALVMKGKGTSPADCSPMAFPAPEGAYEIEVDVETTGDAVGGLTLYYDPNAYAASGIGAGSVWWGQRGKMNGGTKMEGVRRAKLKIVCDRYDVVFKIQLPGGEWKNLPGSNALDVSGYHHNTFGGFTSLRPGVFAWGQGTVNFRHFVYRSLAPR